MARPKPYQTIKERLYSQSSQSENGCIEWQGWRVNGYGRLRLGSKRVAAHRLSYEIENGPIPDGLCVCHKCDNPKCINPSHLFLGTRGDNNLDKTIKGRQAKGKTHGLRGEQHPLSRLTADDVSAIKEKYAGGATQRSIASAHRVSQSLVSQIINSKRWA